MELRARGRTSRAAAPGEARGEEGEHDLHLYRRPPGHTVSLQALERAALDRLRALRELEAAGASGLRPGTAEWREDALRRLKSRGLRDYWRSARSPGRGCSAEELAARAADRLAHFALRLAYCRSERLRRWFVERELELFRLRYAALPPDHVPACLAAAGLAPRPLSPADRAELRAELAASTRYGRADTDDFYRVPWGDVAELVRGRRVLVRGGVALVPAGELCAVLAGQLRARLSRALAEAARRLPRLEADERVAPLLRGLHEAYDECADFESKSALPVQHIDAISTKSFPPCMRHLHDGLRATHHMKHGGRLQYGLFLKAAGVSLEDALRFWRDEFTKAMDGDRFDKMYAYNVRYNYGKEGSKKNYSAYSCAKIIQGNVGPADSHGCPFRHWDAAALSEKLRGYGASPSDATAITDLAKKGHYQLACGKYFDCSHGVSAEQGINHPNQYYEESRNFLTGDRKIAPRSTPIEPIDSKPDLGGPTDEWGEDFDIPETDLRGSTD